VKTTILAPHGGPVDVCWHNGRIVACWQSGKDTNVRLVTVELDPVSHVVLVSYSLGLGDDVGAFPRLLSAHGSVWCIYREGASLGGRAVLLRDGREVWRSPVECGGIDPVCLGLAYGRARAAWQRFGDNQVGVFDVADMVGQSPWAGRPTGLSHIDSAGRVVLVDETRGSIPGMTRPCADGAIIAGEHPDSGVLVRDFRDGRELRIWPGEETVAPRLSASAPTGAHAVVTSGVRAGVDYGVRLATFSVDELVAPGPDYTESPVGTVIADVWRFLVGSAQAWPRTGTHPMDCHVTDDGGATMRGGVPGTQSAWFVKFGNPQAWERWAIRPDGTIFLVEDHSGNDNQRNGECYQFSDGRWLRQDMRVGTVIECPANHLRWFRDGAWTPWQPFPYRMTLDAHRVCRDGHEEITFTYDPGGPHDTREVYTCRNDRGWDAWQHYSQADGRLLGESRWPSPATGSTSPTGARVPWPEARPIVFAPPTPEVPPMPTLKARDQFFDEFQKVNEFYAAAEGLKRPGGMVIGVPVDGVEVPTADVVAMRQWGYDLMAGASLASVLERIRGSEEWKQKHPTSEPDPEDPAPVRPRLAPLRIEGKHFTRNGRPVLPWYLHGGDLISRASRDWDGAVRLLDEAAQLGTDGVRMWSYLLGLPFWQGRTFTPGWAHVARVVEACKARGLQVLLSGGDVWQLGERAARLALQETADFIRTNDPDAFDWVDGGNELWQNGQDNPDRLAQACRVLANIGPLVLLTDAPEGGPYPDGDEGKRLYREHMARWSQSPASMLALHSQFSNADGCIRRTWNGGYETGQWLRAEDETRGPGRNVSVCNDFSPSQVLCLMAASWISGGAPVALCSAGVISDGTKNGRFDQGEGFLEAPGFRDIDRLRRWLPADVMGWARVHGGGGNRGRRVFAVPSNDETRADHAINEATGDYVVVISGESRRGVSQEHDASVEDFPLEDGYRIVKGRIR